MPNPFVIGSGPPGTNANVIGKAFDEGWGAVIAKTISLEAEKSSTFNLVMRGCEVVSRKKFSAGRTSS